MTILFPVDKGHGHDEFSSGTLLRAYVDGAVHHLNDVARYGHSKSGAAVSIAPAAILLRERFKYIRKKLLRYTDTGVLY